tara:strand:+ start:59 stop:1216 length:1158 start_codon:yes stop_codon:yes gene_type:complete
MIKILIIEDEIAIRNVLKNILLDENKHYIIHEASDGEQGMHMLLKNIYDLIICDIKMPKLDGLEVLEKSKKEGIETPFVMISGHGDLETAVECIKKGSFDYISKPPDLNRLLTTIRNALNNQNLKTENKILKKKIHSKYEMIGESLEIKKVKEIIQKIAPTDARVLITGENGTGKELVAHAIHQSSKRNKIPMLEVNCAAIPSELIESELFGHEKGSFTSAHKQKKGKFELADQGTLFLDEIGDMSLPAQAKVLRALQENKITRVGGEKEINVNVRIIAATNKNLNTEIKHNNFREDLLHRLSVIPIKVPSLRDRKKDIPILINYFIKLICNQHGIKEKSIDQEATILLSTYKFPGNIRELRNIIERLIILSDDKITKQTVESYS